MPGTAESQLQLTADCDWVYRGVLSALTRQDSVPRKTAIVGLSFGAHWAAKLALTESVTAAVDIGGPVGFLPLDSTFLSALPNGMPGIIANAIGMSRLPTPEEANLLLQEYSLKRQGLFERGRTAPLLVLNGTHDPYIATEESTCFRRFSSAKVILIKDATHCVEYAEHGFTSPVVVVRDA